MREWPWKTMGKFTLGWIIVVGVLVTGLIGGFHQNGYGRADYGEAFAREDYMRHTLRTGEPCLFASTGQLPCTQTQVNEWHQTYTRLFWQDVRAGMGPLLLVATGILLAGLVLLAHYYR